MTESADGRNHIMPWPGSPTPVLAFRRISPARAVSGRRNLAYRHDPEGFLVSHARLRKYSCKANFFFTFCFDGAGRVHEGAMMADVLMVPTDMIECDGWRVPIRSYCIKIKNYCKLHSGPGVLEIN